MSNRFDKMKKHVIDGYDCFISEMEMPTICTYYCGYVVVPTGRNPKLNILNSNSIACHGGITYDEVIHDLGRVIGFDCAHGGDIPPFGKWKDKAYVLTQLRYIVRQLKEMEVVKNEY